MYTNKDLVAELTAKFNEMLQNQENFVTDKFKPEEALKVIEENKILKWILNNVVGNIWFKITIGKGDAIINEFKLGDNNNEKTN